MPESPVETVQKALRLHINSKSGLTSLWHLESHVEFTASNVDDSWKFLNIVRNHNITLSNWKWSLVSPLTFRSVNIVLRSLAYIPEVSIITRQEWWRCWRNTSIEIQPTITRDYTLGSCRKLRKSMRLPLQWEMRHNSPALRAQDSMFPIQHERSLDLHDGTPDSPQEQPHKSRRTLMLLKECEIIWCNPNQFEITPEYSVLDLVQSPIPHSTRQVACLTLGNYRDSQIYTSQI